ncbi:MAG: hypothetical protein KME43_07490 [Myxacorys chilensis ATA2-1-KO14]|nr:hypothetical protein [Myxacorys chilensis ATA2-1-KO14]
MSLDVATVSTRGEETARSHIKPKYTLIRLQLEAAFYWQSAVYTRGIWQGDVLSDG